MRERHARFYAGLAERVGRRGRALPTRSRGGEPARRAGLAAGHRPASALRLAVALGGWWLRRGRVHEGREWLERDRPRAAARTGGGGVLATMPFAGRAATWPRAAGCPSAAWIYRGLGDPPGAARALQTLGLLAWLRGSYERSRELLEEASAEARIGADRRRGEREHALGLVTISPATSPRARALLERARRAARAQPGRHARCVPRPTPGLVPLADAAGLCRRSRRSRSAVACRAPARRTSPQPRGRRAARGRRGGRPGPPPTRSRPLRAAATRPARPRRSPRSAGSHADRRPDRAREALRESLAIRRRLGDVRSVSLTLALLAELTADGDEAGSLLERALALVGQAGDRPAVMWMLWALARVDLRAGRTDAARERLETSLSVAESLTTRIMRAWTLSALAEVDLHARQRRPRARAGGRGPERVHGRRRRLGDRALHGAKRALSGVRTLAP